MDDVQKSEDLNGQSGMKRAILPVVAVVLLLVIGALLVTFLGDGGTFSKLEARSEGSYSVLIPSGWSRDDSEEEVIYYYEGSNLDTATSSIIVASDDSAIPDFGDLSDEDKNTTIELLKNAFDSDAFASAETGITLDVVGAEETSHPEADRALSVQLSGTDNTGLNFVGEGVIIITSEGGVYIVIVGSTESVFNAESDTIKSILNDFDVL